MLCSCSFSFFFNDTATTEIYTLSLHDALPISYRGFLHSSATKRSHGSARTPGATVCVEVPADRKSTRLNSSHEWISYAVFCLKKKKKSRIIAIAQVQACKAGSLK